MEKSRLHERLQKLTDLTPGCTLAGSPGDQSKLQSLFDTYLNNPGFLKMRRRSSSKEIEQTLGVKNITEGFVSENFEGVKNGVEFWKVFSDLLESFGGEKQKELQSMAADTGSLASYMSEMRASLGEFDAMQELDKKKKEYEKSIFAILGQAKARIGTGEDWAGKIRQEIYAYWLAKIEQKIPS